MPAGPAIVARAGRRGVALAAAWAAALPVAAQTVTLDPSAALACLTPPPASRGEPEYPFDAWKRGETGRVRVELAFTAPDRPPSVKVLESTGDDDFVRAVREHLARWRVPCLDAAPGGPVRLQLEYVFRPDDRRVYGTQPLDLQDERRRLQLGCARHPRGGQPDYPEAALRAGLQGNVLAQMRFAAAGEPPQVTVYARPGARLLAESVERWVREVRMPCFEGPAPISSTWTFNFRLEGEAAFGFKPLSLQQWLAFTRGIQQQTLQIDTTTMACPFDLKLYYRQPYLPNWVGEIGERHPARLPLVEWLAAQQLELPARSLDSVFGDGTTINVPCIRIDLKPKEKT